MELSELKVIPKLQEDTHDDIDMTLTGDGILHLRFDASSIKLFIKNGVIVGVYHG
jgi:hypothetical protein